MGIALILHCLQVGKSSIFRIMGMPIFLNFDSAWKVIMGMRCSFFCDATTSIMYLIPRTDQVAVNLRMRWQKIGIIAGLLSHDRHATSFQCLSVTKGYNLARK